MIGINLIVFLFLLFIWEKQQTRVENERFIEITRFKEVEERIRFSNVKHNISCSTF
jgi:hypothetical protein